MTRIRHADGTKIRNTWYTYDKDNRETQTKVGDSTRSTAYDAWDRVTTQKWKKDSTEIFNVSYEYPDSGNNKVVLPSAMTNGTNRIAYTYDDNGNITAITENGATTSYVYDELNRLTRENNVILNKTITYRYDIGGNLVEKKEYTFTTGTLPAAATKTITGTFDTAWKDKLLSWDGVSMTYDGCGNMLTKGSTTYTWTQGRKLAGVSNGKSIQYFYDHTGNRVKKVVDGVTTEFRMAGRLLLSEKRADDTQQFHYDTNANLFDVLIGGERYLYVKNIQN